MVAASRRVALARQVHTDLVRDALAVRRRPLVRLLGWPASTRGRAYFDIDDPVAADCRPGGQSGRPVDQAASAAR